jgi:CheY-like chemotaxis protein
VDKAAVKILVLDDDPFMLRLLTHQLHHIGFPLVIGCDRGRTALEWVDRPDESPDIIICDLNMPEMDGIEFLRKLVERNYSGGAILVSGEGERVLQAAEKLVRGYGMSLLGYLSKPLRPDALGALLEKWAPISPSAE